MDGEFITHALDLDPAAPVDDALAREWLLTNGCGSYAMGTVLGCNTRRYHGLLIAAGGLPGSRPPAGRIVALNQMWEQVILRKSAAPPVDAAAGDAEQTLEFSALAFRDPAGARVFAPRGHTMLRRFERGLSVRWTYQWGCIGFERHVLLYWKQQAVTLRYRITGLDEAGLSAALRLRPMVTLRDFHALRHQHAAGPFRLDAHGGEYFTVQEPAQPDVAVTLHSSHGSFARDDDAWWHRVWYPLDAERGQDDHEDHYLPCTLVTPVADGVEIAVTAALGAEPVDPAVDGADRAAHLRPIVAALAEASPADAPAAHALALAADDFVVDRAIGGETLSTVLAGYPWFLDWGRDTFIALPGLLLCTGRHDEARRTLRVFAEAIADGLVPNRFDDYAASAAHYNTVDASLWFIHAAVRYVDATDDQRAWRDWLAAACLRIVDAYRRGTRHDIGMDRDGLIFAGSPHTQLTWMDAQCGDVVFTPRWGKAVEINALWHSALVELSRPRAPDAAQSAAEFEACGRLARKVRASFNDTFWNESAGCLYDHIARDAQGAPRPDASIRPNQVFAVSLPHSPLPAARQKRMLQVVTDKLVTPAGLRTLSPDDPAYQDRYTGPQHQRDAAYHQGTVWPWLMGPYAEAVLRAGRFSAAARARARAAIAPLLTQLTRSALADTPPGGCLGQLSEIHEAATLRPVGCPAQAWSVAETLRIHQLIAGSSGVART